MRDNHLNLKKKKNMPVFHGTVSGVPRYGIRCSTVRYPVFHGTVSGVPRYGIRCSTVRYPVFHGTVSGVPRYGIRCSTVRSFSSGQGAFFGAAKMTFSPPPKALLKLTDQGNLYSFNCRLNAFNSPS
jgi:hypothetical protein